MIKSNKGITMVSLTVIVVLLAFLAGVGLNTGINSTQDVKNNNLKSELGMVRQAVVEKYMKAVALGKIEENSDESYWLGTKIQNANDINVPEQTSINLSDDAKEFYSNISNYSCHYPEDYYYRLDSSQLYQIGITNVKSDAQYIVNYKTGEVYNEKAKKDSNSNLLYLPSTNNNITQTKDDVTFNDWN